MPDIPNVPGVPSLSSYAAGFPALLTTDGAHDLASVPEQWGIYFGSAPVVVADSVVSFEYKQEWAISDFPVEQGAFASYNKVQEPYLVRLRYATGGSEQARTAFLSSVAAISGTVKLFTAITPTATYSNVNVTHYDYTRTSVRGLGLLQVDIYLEQVREVTQSAPTGPSTGNAGSYPNGGLPAIDPNGVLSPSGVTSNGAPLPATLPNGVAYNVNAGTSTPFSQQFANPVFSTPTSVTSGLVPTSPAAASPVANGSVQPVQTGTVRVYDANPNNQFPFMLNGLQ